jgi:hypothetical protein
MVYKQDWEKEHDCAMEWLWYGTIVLVAICGIGLVLQMVV